MDRWEITTCKDDQYHKWVGEISNWNNELSLPPSEHQTSKTGTSPNAGKNVDQKELPFIADENGKWKSYFRRQFGSFSQGCRCIFPKLIKNLCPQEAEKTCL